ncbi:hypothetical protein T492DRAFT_1087101 [Pavlovales sp. CCMP2436]|nr:hypothetical protein T492DRAFT_1087101 [Pavlovales sp. CCMP2436]
MFIFIFGRERRRLQLLTVLVQSFFNIFMARYFFMCVFFTVCMHIHVYISVYIRVWRGAQAAAAASGLGTVRFFFTCCMHII